MRITLMGELADEQYELIWDDGDLRGTPRLVERFEAAAREAGHDALAFIAAVERGLPDRPQMVVWPEGDDWPDGDDTDPFDRPCLRRGRAEGVPGQPGSSGSGQGSRSRL